MKELSIEEKARRYDEAIEKGKQIQNTPYTAHWDIMKNVAKYLLPELKESEDERIRKYLITYFSDIDDCASSIKSKDVVAWLEKQANKSVNNVEPKFKQGDIIKEKETGNIFYVNSIEDFGYTLHYKNCTTKGCTMSFKYEDNYELVEQTI